MLRKLLLSLLVLTALASVAVAQVHVDGYTRRDGTYVQPHYRSTPNGSTLDNWSTRGNVNPYTGQLGTREPSPSLPWYQPPPPALVQPQRLSPYDAGYLPRGR